MVKMSQGNSSNPVKLCYGLNVPALPYAFWMTVPVSCLATFTPTFNSSVAYYLKLSLV